MRAFTDFFRKRYRSPGEAHGLAEFEEFLLCVFGRPPFQDLNNMTQVIFTIFLSQPFFVAEEFTGTPGKYVKLEDTIKGFKGLVEGAYDDIPEQAFYMVGGIEEALERAKEL